MTIVIQTQGLSKRYGNVLAVDKAAWVDHLYPGPRTDCGGDRMG
jgi:hypothetical protein